MNVVLWICQVLLAAVFLGSGAAKSVMSKDRMMATGQTGVAPFPLGVIRLVAACELLAVLGVVLPKLTGIVPVLTPLAAVGLAVVMVGAALSHGSRREFPQVALNLTLLAVCVFVAVGRW